MNFYEALFEVVKTDYHVGNDDPWYCADPSAIARIASVLEKVEYKPYLDWCKMLEEEEARRKAEQLKREEEKRKVHLIKPLDDMENFSPNEIMNKFL